MGGAPTFIYLVLDKEPSQGTGRLSLLGHVQGPGQNWHGVNVRVAWRQRGRGEQQRNEQMDPHRTNTDSGIPPQNKNKKQKVAMVVVVVTYHHGVHL